MVFSVARFSLFWVNCSRKCLQPSRKFVQVLTQDFGYSLTSIVTRPLSHVRGALQRLLGQTRTYSSRYTKFTSMLFLKKYLAGKTIQYKKRDIWFKNCSASKTSPKWDCSQLMPSTKKKFAKTVGKGWQKVSNIRANIKILSKINSKSLTRSN